MHYPCDSQVKVQMRICLPNGYYRSHDKRLEIIKAVFKALEIPEDETYKAAFLEANEQIEVIHPEDRVGRVDAFYD